MTTTASLLFLTNPSVSAGFSGFQLHPHSQLCPVTSHQLRLAADAGLGFHFHSEEVSDREQQYGAGDGGQDIGSYGEFQTITLLTNVSEKGYSRN